MKPFQKFLRMLKDRSGATVIEYCLIAGIISIAIVGGATTMGTQTNSSFNELSDGFNS
ncbi:MAG TPA: Flp family type IVb pilin [Hyphomonadaceae bacterium]|nr:Flp family type IVb pilin [Hyphomonadaceae bacterium]HPI49736.1 Flp family type IVb pilin [Hyphomonadaceae bacterium]